MTIESTEKDVQGWFAGRVAHTKEWIGQHWPHFVTWVALGWSTINAFLKAHGL